jgi:hypothetical protein
MNEEIDPVQREIDPIKEEIDPAKEEIDPKKREIDQKMDENDPMTGETSSSSSWIDPFSGEIEPLRENASKRRVFPATNTRTRRSTIHRNGHPPRDSEPDPSREGATRRTRCSSASSNSCAPTKRGAGMFDRCVASALSLTVAVGSGAGQL